MLSIWTAPTLYCLANSYFSGIFGWTISHFPYQGPRIDDSHCNRIHPLSQLSIVSTIVMWESSQWLGKSTVRSTGKNVPQKCMDRCPGLRNITEITLKTALRYSNPENRGFKSVISVVIGETTLFISGSTGEPVSMEFDIVRVVSLSTMVISEITRLKIRFSGSLYLKQHTINYSINALLRQVTI